MFYITALVNRHNTDAGAAMDAFRYLYGITPNDPVDRVMAREAFPRTFTKQVEAASIPPPPPGYSHWFDDLLQHIDAFKQAWPDPREWYLKFYIPKASGGFREINAPIEPLKMLQREIVFKLSGAPGRRLPIVHAHDCAFAYIEQRSTKHAMIEHQANGSNWFLKLDVKDFFPSCTKERVVENIGKVYPLCHIPLGTLDKIVEICCLNGVLPQGAPTSPFLTNILMVPLDKAISDIFSNWNRRKHVYTRYADDILISAREKFNWQEAQAKVQGILAQHDFILKTEKTRYGSRAGRNWNLGLMLNKDNQLTLGHKHKQRMRAAVHSFIKDFQAGSPWDIGQTSTLVGQLSYLESIEPDYKRYIVAHYEDKLHADFRAMVKQCLTL